MIQVWGIFLAPHPYIATTTAAVNATTMVFWARDRGWGAALAESTVTRRRHAWSSSTQSSPVLDTYTLSQVGCSEEGQQQRDVQDTTG